MGKTIMEYQKAFNSTIDRLKADSSVLAVMVFGSMVTGDLWEESDIDMFVVVDDNINEIKNIYTEDNGIPVHIKLMGKETFLKIHTENLKGGYMHRIFSSSRLVFSKDVDITVRYDGGRFYPDIDRQRWCMVYLGELLKDISVCKKYLASDGIYTAYSAAIKCTEDFAKLYINSSGYMISKDVMTMAMNLNDEFKDCVENLFFNKALEPLKSINYTLDYFNKFIVANIKNNTSVLIDYMMEKNKPVSSEEIKRDALFKDFNINIEDIVSKLWELNIIKKDGRDYKVKRKGLFKENVYYI